MPNPPLFWTPAQRRALIALLSLLLAMFYVELFRDRRYVPDPLPTEGSRAAELESRVDPNAADWQTLAAIPGLGETRARAIVRYREQAGGGSVFRRPEDLRNVRGVGPATVENIRPWLRFPTDSTAGAP